MTRGQRDDPGLVVNPHRVWLGVRWDVGNVVDDGWEGWKVNKKRLAIWNKSGGKCWYCGCDLPDKGWHADHVEPIYRTLKYDRLRGLHTTDECYLPERDTDANKVPSCASCNINKHTMSVEEFRRQIQRFVNSLNARSVQYNVAKRYGLIAETQEPVVFWFEREERERDGMAGRD